MSLFIKGQRPGNSLEYQKSPNYYSYRIAQEPLYFPIDGIFQEVFHFLLIVF